MAAYALRVPLVCLWGAFADPSHYFDLTQSNISILGHPMDCSYRFTRDYEAWLKQPCLKNNTCPCIRSIEVDEAVDSVERMVTL